MPQANDGSGVKGHCSPSTSHTHKYIPSSSYVIRTVLSHRKPSNVVRVKPITVSEYNEELCLKWLQAYKDGIYDFTESIQRRKALLEGYTFNRKLTPHIYLGIAPLKYVEDLCEGGRIEIGDLIQEQDFRTYLNEKSNHFEQEIEYALVMKCPSNPDGWLDCQLKKHDFALQPEKLVKLARDIASIHQQLEPAPPDFGTIARLQGKLNVNLKCLYSVCRALGLEAEEPEAAIAVPLKAALHRYQWLFKQRWERKHIKRCHGDLKANNIYLNITDQTFDVWIIDCIDFDKRSDFYYIDTLSDLAMLLVSILRHLEWKQWGILLNTFFDAYSFSSEIKAYEPLLWYYMAEKAIVCAYTSLFYDKASKDFSKGFLDIAKVLASKLTDKPEVIQEKPPEKTALIPIGA
uniref:Uncharacterized protein n=1 Tax=Thermosporothrix sp. COM3 TaxID=2490863 RepID=A0A455SNY9_9CHLR|nr:hypothetical protein KTC_38790 [Thermosporothrix sp. COM3]